MNETINKNSFTMTCACENPNHMLILEIFPGMPNEKEFDAFVYLSGNFRAPWYIRVLFSFFYLFKPNPYMWGNVVHLDEKNINTIINLGKSLEEIKALNEQKETIN